MNKNRVLCAIVVVVLSVAVVGCCAGLPQVARPTPTEMPRPTWTPEPTSVPRPPSVEPPAQAANALEAQIVALYEAAGPSVAFITSRVIAYDYHMQPVPQEGSGSGFVYDREGHIVTNFHVVENAEEVTVAFAGGESYPATIVGQDPSTDLAVLKIDATDLPRSLAVADSKNLRVGQFVVAIGNPFGLERTLTFGVISALERVIQSPNGRFIGEAIQTDAAINPGNSGGPMLNLSGEVIGVNSQIISPSGANAGIGFAIASNTVRRVVPELIAHGRYPHPWLGVNLLALTADNIQLLEEAGMSIPVDKGILILEVVSGGPAADAGLRGGQRVVRIRRTQVPIDGDIVTAVDGNPLASSQDLTLYLESQTRVGDTVQLSVVRDGREMEVPLVLAERPEE